MTTSAGINSIVGYPFAGNANNTTNGGLAVEVATATSEIGRASCRERV